MLYVYGGCQCFVSPSDLVAPFGMLTEFPNALTVSSLLNVVTTPPSEPRTFETYHARCLLRPESMVEKHRRIVPSLM